jgi:hypothetical protein
MIDANVKLIKPSVILLGAHRWRRQHVIQVAQEEGFNPIILLYDQEELPDDLSGAFGPQQIIRQSAASPRSAREIAAKMQSVDGDWFVVGLDDYVCEYAAELSTYAAQQTMSSYAAKATLHKHLLRAKWNDLCEGNPKLFPVPFRVLTYADATFNDHVRTVENSAFQETVPLIVKPDALDASIAIHKVETWTQVDNAIEHVIAEISPIAKQAAAFGINVTPSILVEHQIPRNKLLHRGAEFSAEFLSSRVKNGAVVEHLLIGITQKYINPETFVEVAHCFPSETFPDDLRDTLLQVTSHLLTDLGVQLCISHWEYIITEDGRLALVEAQLRPAGDRIMTLVSRATGSDPYRILFNAFKRKSGWSLPDFRPKRCAAIFFPVPEREVQGDFRLVCGEHVRTLFDKDLFIQADMANTRSWGRRLEWYSRYVEILTEGDTFEATKQKCERILPDLIVYCPAGSGPEQRVRLTLPL